MEENALLFGISLFVADTPWYVLACTPFLEEARVKKRTMVLFGILVGALKAASGGLLVAFVPGWRSFLMLHFFLNAVLLFLFYRVSFRSAAIKLLYAMLFINAYATAVNYIGYIAVAPFYPGQSIGASTTPAYTVALVLGNAVFIPFAWRFFRGRLRQTFTELPRKDIRLLCLPPVLFYLLNQVYTALIQTSGLSSVSISVLNLLLVAVAILTFYINLRTALDSVARARAESEMKTQLALKEQAAQVRADMIDTLSHEVRTPLAVMSVYAQLAVRQIQNGKVTQQTAADLATISEEAKRLAELAESTLQLSRLSAEGAAAEEAAAHVPEVGFVDIGAVARQICNLFATMAEQRERSLRVDIPDALPQARCDADSLTRILWNLLGNALVHSVHGDITVRAEAGETEVRLMIEDEGVGIAPERLPHVFERGVSGAEGGAGLGLAISRQEARRFGGDMVLHSEEGRGTTAIVTLPVSGAETGAGKNGE